jgi:hypothetical protein
MRCSSHARGGKKGKKGGGRRGGTHFKLGVMGELERGHWTSHGEWGGGPACSRHPNSAVRMTAARQRRALAAWHARRGWKETTAVANRRAPATPRGGAGREGASS